MMYRALLDLVQGALTSLDTSMTVATREEDRDWWQEDLAWREADVAWREYVERPAKEKDMEHRRRASSWIAEDREQSRPVWRMRVCFGFASWRRTGGMWRRRWSS